MSCGLNSDRFINELRLRLENRLAELEGESRCIRRALNVLGPAAGADSQEQESVIGFLQTMPNARASVLAMARGQSIESVEEELHRLETQGAVVKNGPRWNLRVRHGSAEV